MKLNIRNEALKNPLNSLPIRKSLLAACFSLFLLAIHASPSIAGNSAINNEAVYGAPLSSSKPIGYRIINVNSRKCLDIKSADRVNKANIQQYQCHAGPNQNWTMDINIGGGLRVISTYSRKCLDITHGAYQNRANIQQYDCHYGANQGFLPVVVTNNSNRSIYDGAPFKLMAAGPYMNNRQEFCVDIRGGVTENGGNVQLYKCHGGTAQEFVLEAVYETVEEYCNANYLYVYSPYDYPPRGLQFSTDNRLIPAGIPKGRITTIDLRRSSEPDIFGRKGLAWLCWTPGHVEEVTADIIDLAEKLSKEPSVPREKRLELTLCSGNLTTQTASCGVSKDTLKEAFLFVIELKPFQEAVRNIFDPDPTVRHWCPPKAKRVVVNRHPDRGKFTLTCIG